MRRTFCSFSVICAMMLVGIARAEQMENPAYKQWAKFKPGTSATMTNETVAAGQTTKSEMKSTLKEVTDDKVTIEVATTMEVAGQKMAGPAQSIEIKKMVDKPADGAKPASDKEQPHFKSEAKTSDEEVKVGAGTFKATKTESNSEASGMKTKATVWTSEEVPGGIVKMESTTDGSFKSETKGELTAVDKK
jgi:hypothetical protein